MESLRLARRIVLGTQTMQKYAHEEFLPGPGFQTDVGTQSANSENAFRRDEGQGEDRGHASRRSDASVIALTLLR